MTKREKRLSKLRHNLKNVSKDELEQVLFDYGFVRREGKGSHTVYQHPYEETPIVVAAHGKHVPPYIVKQVIAVIDRLIERDLTDERTIEYYLGLPYQLLITPDDEGFGVEFPDLPGCFTHAEQWDDIQEMAQEAMALWIGVMLSDGKPIPEPALPL